MKKNLTILSVLLFMCTTEMPVMAQKDFKKPRWIKLMHDPSANYFETVKAFDKYWKTREKPEEEGEKKVNEKREKKRPLLRSIFVSEEKEEEQIEKIAMEYKFYKRWKREMLPYVQPDGSILNQEQQLELWKNQRQ